jgi:hypothetical protein
MRAGTVLAFTGLLLSFVLSAYLKDPTPFTAVGSLAVGGKWAESFAQRKYSPRQEAA